MHHIIKKNILCYIVFYIILWMSIPCYAQININPKLYNYTGYVHKREMIFALGWDTDYRAEIVNSWNESGFGVNSCKQYQYTRVPIIYDLSELLVKNNYDSVKNIWFPAPIFMYGFYDYDDCSVNNLFNFLVNSVVKYSMDYNLINVMPDSENMLTLSASKVARTVHLEEMRYNKLYLFKCKVSYFPGPSRYTYIPNLSIKYKQITHDYNFKKYFNELNHKGLFYNKFDHVMRNMVFTPMKWYLFKEDKIIFNYIYDISEIEVFPVSKIKAYKKQIKSGLK